MRNVIRYSEFVNWKVVMGNWEKGEERRKGEGKRKEVKSKGQKQKKTKNINVKS